jgi:hypothetical protein
MMGKCFLEKPFDNCEEAIELGGIGNQAMLSDDHPKVLKEEGGMGDKWLDGRSVHGVDKAGRWSVADKLIQAGNTRPVDRLLPFGGHRKFLL